MVPPPALKASALKAGAKHGVFYRVILFAALYLGLSYFGGIGGWRLLYPIRLFVTFLHEFGHALGAILTGGDVLSVRIDPNAGGATTTTGGSRPVILMGGYIGSAIFGNILFFIGAKSDRLVKPILTLVIVAMLATGFIWFNSVFTTAVLIGFSAALLFIGFKTPFGDEVLMFLGLVSVIYIIQDTGTGPSSDLKMFEREMWLPAKVWMFVWLGIALGLIALNLKLMFGMKKRVKPQKP